MMRFVTRGRPMKARIASLIPQGAALCGVLLASLTLSTVIGASRSHAQPQPGKFSAVYQLRFAGITLGDYKLWSNVTPDRYSLQGQGKITFLASVLFELTGGATSSGELTPAGPRPGAFSFTFKTRKANGHLVMKFNNGMVSTVASQPPLTSHPAAVPVTEEHVRGVLDPLTALFMVAEAGTPGRPSSVCDRKRVPVYDGKYRFDLQLAHKKTVRVVRKKGKTNGYAGPAVICQVKYIPVAGHRADMRDVAMIAERDDIEVWLIPLPQGRTYVPYHVSIPTPYGTAQATSTAFHIEMPSQKKIAVVQ